MGYEEAEKDESPAIIAPDLVDEAALYAGENSDHADEEDSSGGEDSEVAQESADGATPAPGRLTGKKRSRRDKRRRTRAPGLAESDRIVLLVETKPFGPRELRRQPTVDYRRLNKGEYVGIRTISCVKAYYEPTEPDPAELAEAKKEALRIARMLATDLKRLSLP